MGEYAVSDVAVVEVVVGSATMMAGVALGPLAGMRMARDIGCGYTKGHSDVHATLQRRSHASVPFHVPYCRDH